MSIIQIEYGGGPLTGYNHRNKIVRKFPMGMIIMIFLFHFLPASAQEGPYPDIRTVKIYSSILDEERTCSVFLPEGYGQTGNTYPVLYILDAEGARLFPGCISTLRELNKKYLAPAMILVGVENTNRNRDMIPESVSHRPGSGGSKRFLDFLQKELKPHIQEKFSTSGYSLLYGMSNSALFAVYALLEKPESFDAVIASSPMIGHCPEYMNKKAEAFIQQEIDTEIILFMICGSEDSPRVTQYVPGFQNYLNSHAPKGFKTKLEILQSEGHVPDSSLARGLQHVFEH